MMRQFQPTIVCEDLALVPGFAGLLRGQYVRVRGVLGRVLGTVDGVPHWTDKTQPAGFRDAVRAFRMEVARRIVRAAVLGPFLPAERVMSEIEAANSCLAFALLAYIVLGAAVAACAVVSLRRGLCLAALLLWAIGLYTYARGVIHAPDTSEAEV